MTHRFAICLAIASLLFLVPRPAAAADVTYVFDTVDNVELKAGWSEALAVTGILSGSSTPTTRVFGFSGSSDLIPKCERLALLSMSKPGRYQLVIVVSNYDYYTYRCKLVRRTP